MKNKIKEIAENIDFIKQKLYETTYIPNTFYINEYQSFIHNVSDPCINCPNNPMNNPFASGVCNCILKNNIVY